MNFLPKTRYSGLIIIIILFLILALGFLLVYTRHQNEQLLISKAFVKLQQNSLTISSKIREYSRICENTGQVNPKPVTWAVKGYVINIGPDNNAWVTPNTIEDHSSFSTKRFFSDLVDRSMFDEFCVFDSASLFFKTFQVESQKDRNYLKMLTDNLYLPDNYHIFNRKKDSVLMRSSVNTGFISKTYINYRKYYQFVYPMRVNNQLWYVSGLIYDKNYRANKQHVETWVLILIAILLVFTFFSFQFIKLLLLTKTERIKTVDTVLICFSLSGLACIIPLLIINLYTVTGIRNNTDTQLISLNNAIKSGFINELKLMYNATVAYEKTGIKFSPRKHILSDTCALQLFKDPAAITNYPYFKGLYTSSVKKDSSSYIVSTWEDVSSSKISYRKYFLKNGEWSFPSTGGDKRFRLESIYSNTSGDVMAVLSRPSPDLPDSLFCISSVMYSLINTILPEGFEFRIIGKDGMVWFHSDQKKNNRENFLEECSYNSEIREAIHNRVSALVPLQLSPKNYRSYISPIGTIPLYLVTLSDTREQNEFLSHVNYMILIFVLIGIFCALVSTVIFYYEQLGIAFNGRMANDPEPGLIWLLPDLRKNERYMILTRLNLLLALLILIPAFFLRITELHYLFILISLYSIFFMYCYSLLKTFKKKTFKPSIIFTFSVILVCCNIVYIKFLPREYLFFILELVALVVVSVVLYRILRHQHFSREDFEETDFVNMKVKYFSFSDEPYLPYVLFIYSWIMIAAILPTLLLFKISGREEVELITRKNQLEVASRIDRKNFQIDSFYIEHIYPRDEKNNPCFPGTSTKNLDRIKENLKLKGNYSINQYSQVNANVETSPKYHSDNPDRDYIILTRKLREMFGADDIRSFEMLYGIGSDTAWFWTGGHLNGARSDCLHFFYTATKRKADRSYAKYQVKLSSDMANQKTNPRSFGFMLHFSELLVILLFMVLLFFMLRRVIRKLFILEVPYIPNVMQKGDVLEKTDRLFIVNSLHQASVKELLNEPFSILESDKSGNWVISENNLVILNAIPENLRHWLQLFNGMNSLRESKGQVIILSCYSPGQITEMADESIQAIPKDRIRNSLLRVKNKFLHLLSEFTVCYYVDVQGLNLPDLAGCAKAMEPRHSREILAFLQSELKFVGYQGGMENRLKNIICKETELKNLRPEFFNLFATRYQFIWERLTINEKFILIDLAVDSVVNTRNRADINNLVGKGILDMKGRLDFASSGFKQFVLDLSATDVFQALQKNIKRADGWNKIKVPLYIIFGAVVIFFFFTLQDVVTGIFGTILSLGGFFTALWKLGLFDKAAPSGK